MRGQRFFSVVACILLGGLSSCCHKPVSTTIAIQSATPPVITTYVEKGDKLRFASTDSTGFVVDFLGGWCGTELTSPDGSERECTVTGSEQLNPYVYSIGGIGHNSPTGPTKDTSPPPAYSLAQVGNCPNCKTTKTGAGKTTGNPPPANPAQTTYIACDAGTAIEVPPITSASTGVPIDWDPASSSTNQGLTYGATFSSSSPCKEGSGPLVSCTLMSTGSYTYTVNRSDCKNPSLPITLTVQNP